MMSGWKTWISAAIFIGLGTFLMVTGETEKGIGLIGTGAGLIGIGSKLDKLTGK
jgi:hypothetical protein